MRAMPGMRVDFEIRGSHAVGIYPMPGVAPSVPAWVNLQGTILSLSGVGYAGVIAGDDGIQYTLTPGDWGDLSTMPAVGMRVNFVGRGTLATEVFPVHASAHSSPTSPPPMVRYPQSPAIPPMLHPTHTAATSSAPQESQTALATGGALPKLLVGALAAALIGISAVGIFLIMQEDADDEQTALGNGYARTEQVRVETTDEQTALGNGYARTEPDRIEPTNEGANRAMETAVVLARYSTTDDTEAERRATSVRETTSYVERGNMDNDTALDLLNDIAPEAAISERRQAAERLSSISADSDGELTPEQSMLMANELTRLMTGQGIDADQRVEAAREMVRLSQAGNLEVDNAAELMGVIAPEWSVQERQEALGFLAWQFAEGEWDAAGAQRTAEEGYTLITGGEMQIERRMEAGVELAGEGVKWFGGRSLDDDSVDLATQMLRDVIGGDLSPDTVSHILGRRTVSYPSVPAEYRSAAYLEAYSSMFQVLSKSTRTVDMGFYVRHRSTYTRGQAYWLADVYAEQVANGKSKTYARAYMNQIKARRPERDARIFAGIVDAGRSYKYAGAYVDQINSGRSPRFAHVPTPSRSTWGRGSGTPRTIPASM